MLWYAASCGQPWEAVNYSVVEALNDADGLRMASRADIGVIVLDCMGSNAGGLRTLKKLRTEPGTASIPVLAMSGLGQCGYDLPMWANACLVKPFRPNQLIRKIQEVAGSERQAVIPERDVATLQIANV